MKTTFLLCVALLGFFSPALAANMHGTVQQADGRHHYENIQSGSFYITAGMVGLGN